MFFPFAYYAEFFLIVPYRAEMFNLGKMKSDSGTSSRSTVSLITSAFAIIGVTSSMIEKRPNAGEEAGQRKHIMKVASEQPMDASGSTTRSPNKKGKGGGVDRGGPRVGLHHPDLCERGPPCAEVVGHLQVIPSVDRGPLAGEYLWGALHPILVKQVYECSFEELMNRTEKSVVWGLHFVSAVIDRVHDPNRLVWSQHERILALRAANKELKLGANQELVTASEYRVKELEDEVKKSQAELESLMNQQKELEQEVGVLRSSLDGARND
ncbi:hypothetical protein B296_00036623 [Ensete ventricosum]|uniref:Uncharacterized protein n=1 Tax=Ensete ventricosum TaxID=4639 RepID=A0A426YZ65_ENSVE|nr:hypothetical protein B296_00036623 [Ensete ventricosum]